MSFCVFIVNFQHISHLVLVFLLLTLDMQFPAVMRLSRDTLIFLLHILDFVISTKKKVFELTLQLKFLGLSIDTSQMTLSLTEEKLAKVIKSCQDTYHNKHTTGLELIGLLSTVQAVLPGKLQCNYLQEIQIAALRRQNSYQAKAKMTYIIYELGSHLNQIRFI